MNNMSQVINMLADFKLFIIMVLLFTIFSAYWFNKELTKYSLHNEKRGIVGLFYRLNIVQTLQLSVSYLTVIYILFSCIDKNIMKLQHIYMYVVLCIFRILLSLNKKYSIIILLNRFMQGIALIMINFMLNYVQNIRYDRDFEILYWSATIMVLVYSLYVFIGEVIQVSNERKL